MPEQRNLILAIVLSVSTICVVALFTALTAKLMERSKA